MSLDIRPMSRADLDVALGWARDEGWNPGHDDAEPFHAQDPTGFLMGWLEGEPVGCVSVVKYDERFAFLGLYIVRPPWRGQGYGKAIWDAGIASAGHRAIGLDGVVAQQENYRKSGFILAHRNARWIGIVEQASRYPDVREIAPADLPSIEQFDLEHFPAPRTPFLTQWLRADRSRYAVLCMKADTIAGYGVLRRSAEGFKIGPLFAVDEEIGEALFTSLAQKAAGAQIAIDIPASNLAAQELVRRFGFTRGFETARMYRGNAPVLPLMQTYGITTLELG